MRAAAQKLGIPRTTLTDWLDILAVEERFQRAVVDNFEGGDSPVTISHVAEARALAATMDSPGLATAFGRGPRVHSDQGGNTPRWRG